jgi:ubiquinone biosynthesis protein COQ4
VGSEILAENRSLLSALRDQEKLEAMPEGSLGRAYLEFLRSQQITADGLVAASMEGDLHATELDAERRLFSDRLRDMHDLWHVVAGYRGDLIGEAAILALSFAQTRNPGVGMISLLGFLKEGDLPGARGVIVRALVRGHRAAWLSGVDWESMLARPLTEVRRELGLSDTPTYEPVYTSDPRYIEAHA